VIARGEHPSTERKLHRAGAHPVVMPTHIGAERIARMILYPRSEGIATDTHLAKARRDLEALGLELEEVETAPGATLCGMTIDEAEHRAGGIFVVQIVRDGVVIPRPGRNERIAPGDRLLVVLRDSWHAARTLFTNRADVRG
jgi:voltage-gated potassium channel